jgi:hypothetical protein
MTNAKPAAENLADREIVLTRVFDAPANLSGRPGPILSTS